MGQKIHPHGLRVGIHRKWSSSWFASGLEWKNLFFYQKEVENFFKSLFFYYPYTNISKTKKILLFDVKIFKYTINKLFIFIFFYKLRTKRRKDLRPIINKKKKLKFRGKKKYIKVKVKLHLIWNFRPKLKNRTIKKSVQTKKNKKMLKEDIWHNN